MLELVQNVIYCIAPPHIHLLYPDPLPLSYITESFLQLCMYFFTST